MADKNIPPSTEAAPDGQERQLTCFVVIGFGRKTDFATGRVLDLDLTYHRLIRPSFDKVNINCFRAIDANLAGSIDAIMYEWLYAADFVIADLSTLNANVFYELGVRHAQKPNTTLIIAEQVLMQKIPFDLGSFVIHSYNHDGESISEQEQNRFVDYMSGILQKLLDQHDTLKAEGSGVKRKGDSPVYEFLDNMEPPRYNPPAKIYPPPYIAPAQRKTDMPEGKSLASLVSAAEKAKEKKEFSKAIDLLKKSIAPEKSEEIRGFSKTIDLLKEAIGLNKKPDIFIIQRLVLLTYKNGETKGPDNKIDKEKAIAALLEAETILESYCAPKISTDPETLGLSGAINKRLFEHTGESEYLDKSIQFHERGFYVKQDYYNGINAAFLYTLKANLTEDQFQAITFFGHAIMLRKKVAELCEEILQDTNTAQKRDDLKWIYTTLAEAYFGMGILDKTKFWERKIDLLPEDELFARDSYHEQKEKLRHAMQTFDDREFVDADYSFIGGKKPKPTPAPAPITPATENMLSAPAPASQTDPKAITIHAHIEKDKPIKSVEVHCKIEYT